MIKLNDQVVLEVLLSTAGITCESEVLDTVPDRVTVVNVPSQSVMFIDGVRVQQSAASSVDDVLSPDVIAGVEMYPRALTAPAQYQDAFTPDCGVVLFWTKGPELGQSRGWGAKRIAAGLGLILGLVTVGLIS